MLHFTEFPYVSFVEDVPFLYFTLLAPACEQNTIRFALALRTQVTQAPSILIFHFHIYLDFLFLLFVSGQHTWGRAGERLKGELEIEEHLYRFSINRTHFYFLCEQDQY